MNDVCVPAELVEALRKTVRVWDASEVAIAARALVDAVERPSGEYVRLETAEKYRARAEAAEAKLTAPAAPPSEPLCTCGESVPTATTPGPCYWAENAPSVESQVHCPRPSISDEAEAAWRDWRMSYFDESKLTDCHTRNPYRKVSE